MSDTRFFLNTVLEKDKTYSLEEEEFHHLVNVLRLKEEDSVTLINGQGLLAKGTITSLKKKEALILVNSVIKEKDPTELSLYVALLRPQNIDFVLEKGTELGITHFYFFEGDKSEKGIKNALTRIEKRSKTLLISALKQCKRTFLPKFTYLPPIKNWKSVPPFTFFGSLLPHSLPFFTHLTNLKIASTVPLQFIIGPESGFSEEEEKKLLLLNALPTTLSTHVLRAETAAMTAAALMENRLLAQ